MANKSTKFARGFKLVLSKIARSSECDSSDSKLILSERRVALATLKEEKSVLGTQAHTKNGKILRKPSMARTFIVLASLFALVISTLLPIGQALAVPATTTTPTNTSTAPTTPSGTVNAVTPTNSTNTANSTVTTVADNPDEMQTCDQAAGPLSFFLCPVYAMMMKGINWLAGPEDSILTQMLHVPPLQFTKDVGLMRAYGNILAFVNSLFILVFLVIIVLSLIKDFTFLENYHLKQTLPRLVAAIIIAQFGYLLCGILIDIGNILGTLIPNTIAAGVLGTGAKLPGLADSVVGLLAFGNPKAVGETTAVVTNTLFGAGTGVVFILLFLMAVAVLFSLLLAFIYMIARYLIITLLVLAAPLAFLAWVLPGTQSFFFKWGKNLLRLIMMYPLVVTVITTAEILAFLLQHPSLDPSIYTDDRLKLLIGGLIPFVALLMIPKLLKLSGDLVEITGGAVAGLVAGTVASKSRDKDFHNAAWRDKMAESKFGKENSFGRALSGGGATALFSPNSPTAVRKLGEARKRANAVYENAAKLGTEDELKAMLGNKNAVARQSAIVGLAKRGKRDSIHEGLKNGNIRAMDMSAVNTAEYDAFKSMPDLREWNFDPAKNNGNIGVPDSYYHNLSSDGFYAAAPSIGSWFGRREDVGGGVKEFRLTSSGPDDFRKKFSPAQMHDFLGDSRNRNKIGVDIRKELIKYAYVTNPGDAHAQAIQGYLKQDNTWK